MSHYRDSNWFKGMVHRLRQREKRQNCTVYGVAADAQYFFFLKINEKSRVSLLISLLVAFF
jgi:hypothetical protein